MWAYLNNLAVLITINAILAVTLNFVLGYAGIFSMAHAAFFGIGAYTAALVAIKLGGGFLLATAAGMSVAGLLSLALALPALRVRGEYFVAASLGLQMLALTLFAAPVVFRLWSLSQVPDIGDPFDVAEFSQRDVPADQKLAVPSKGPSFAAVVRKGNAWGVQFHPEKSLRHGMQILSNFLRFRP